MKIKHLDYFLLFILALFLISGISFLATISAPASLKKFETTNYYLIHQLTHGFLPGIILGLVCFLIPLGFLRKISPIILLANLMALFLVFLPQIGSRIWGASRWLNFGIINFQPSEFLKISSILYLSSWLKNRLSYQHQGKGILKSKRVHYTFKQVFLPFLVFLAVISIILILQPDISTLGIIGVTALIIYFAAGTPVWHSFLIIIGAVSGLALLIKYEAYRMSRLIVFLHPEVDPMGIGFQMKQALISIGSGGLGGRGLGLSSQKFGFLPQSMSDSTFAIIAEELGFIGCVFLILLFLIFLWVGLMIARRADDKFSQLVALGITFWIVLQGFVNISSMIGILPLTGIPLPFISYGGSHIVAELIGVGILLNIARHNKS
ncbi:putative lipid II flippase FtsW [Patescibacteria group bacterium]|nr:putative lipid II flippase FtsW [Patescibacteria group bacterium]MBU4367763.1 putative lipid II flippase FtsW [Patescibacteria group bacterium]MBU4461490.1 putative lipid II flippase FtsW [Patescibacteria group bacterium]MCG2700322.1 putative lipid II flippase FtsW [Candidatus Parcubacteria bacterium]